MRLIHATTLQVSEFFGADVPPYAILSHTWGKDELTFQDMHEEPKQRDTLLKAGYQKVAFACAQALRDGLAWAWVDTCCIDKTSSAELSEAINSMYAWYRDSAVCYAYLSDFSQLRPDAYVFERSRWFTRSWTLQELVAPRRVVLYDVNWSRIGGLHEPGDAPLLRRVAGLTGIPEPVLAHLEDPAASPRFSAARRMSWAAARQCTRPEDGAYSLMGLFGVNMPLLYGEGGRRAFLRLQEEILRDSDDQTLLAWTVGQDDPRAFAPAGVLAESPACFAASGALLSVYNETVPSTMTKLGLSIRVPLRRHVYPPESHLHQGCLARDITVFDALLNCGLDADRLVVVRLLMAQPVQQARAADGPSRSFYRLAATRLQYEPASAFAQTMSDIYIAKNIHLSPDDPPFGSGGIHLQNLPLHPVLGGVPSAHASFLGYTAKLVSGLTTASTSERKLRWFKTYGCVQFAHDDLGLYNDPFHVLFEGENDNPRHHHSSSTSLSSSTPSLSSAAAASTSTPQKSSSRTPAFCISIGYAENWIYLEVTSTAGSPSGRPHGTDPSAKERFRQRCLDGRQSYRDRYGVVARCAATVEGRVGVEAWLHREDPRTHGGEAAGSRRHFMLFVEVRAAPAVARIGALMKTGVSSGSLEPATGELGPATVVPGKESKGGSLKHMLKTLTFPKDAKD